MGKWQRSTRLDNLLHNTTAINREAIQIGHEKGRKAEKIEVAKNSLKAGVSIDVIAEITGLSVDEIKELRS